jgi:hypothetical protein
MKSAVCVFIAERLPVKFHWLTSCRPLCLARSSTDMGGDARVRPFILLKIEARARAPRSILRSSMPFESNSGQRLFKSPEPGKSRAWQKVNVYWRQHHSIYQCAFRSPVFSTKQIRPLPADPGSSSICAPSLQCRTFFPAVPSTRRHITADSSYRTSPASRREFTIVPGTDLLAVRHREARTLCQAMLLNMTLVTS